LKSVTTLKILNFFSNRHHSSFWVRDLHTLPILAGLYARGRPQETWRMMPISPHLLWSTESASCGQLTVTLQDFRASVFAILSSNKNLVATPIFKFIEGFAARYENGPSIG